MAFGRSSDSARIEIRLRNNGMLEACIPLKPGQALAAYLTNRRGAINLTDVFWRDSGRHMDRLTLLEHEIAWARPLDGNVSVTNVELTPGGTLALATVVTMGGQSLTGRFALIKGQGISDMLSRSGPFPVLHDARLADDRRLGDVVLSLSAIRSVRELDDSGSQELWERGRQRPGAATTEALPSSPSSDAAASRPVHWLLSLARRAANPDESLALPPATPTLDVWWALTAAGQMDQNGIAQMIAQELRLPLASSIPCEPDAESAIPVELAQRFGVRALRANGRSLVVATIDPMDADAEQALSFACKRRIEFAVATPDWLGLSAVAGDPDTELESLLAAIPSLTTDLVRVEEDLDPQNVAAGEVTSEPIIKLANLILREAVRQNASDVHMEPDGSRGLIRFRVDGVLRQYMHVPLAALSRVISRFKILGRLDIADRVRPQDGRVRVRIDGRPIELRLSTVPTQDLEKAVIRIAGAVQEQTLDQIGAGETELTQLRQLLGHRDGIIVVTGPTGSGKTTTLYAALHELNTGRVNIMTVEDPVERTLAGATQIQVQPRRGVTFASALRAVLRQDPDIILIGEIRDLETAEIAVQAAMTGHLVLTTLHTTTAVGVVERLRDLGLDRTRLASSLRGIVAQRLARRICDECEGDGCPRCDDSGYRGRLPIMEVLTPDAEFSELIGRGAPYHELQRAALAHGMRTMRDVAAQRIADGLTTEAEILRVLGDVDAHDTHAPAQHHADDEEILELTVEVPELEVSEQAQVPAVRADSPDDDAVSRWRTHAVRSLLQGLDRCVAEGQQIDDMLAFACSQLAVAFDAPLVWAALRDGNDLMVRARAGTCAPWFDDLVPHAGALGSSESLAAAAVRTGAPQGFHAAQDSGPAEWRESARMHGVPIYLAVPMNAAGHCVGVVGIHARGMAALDRQSGTEIVTIVERIATAVQRLRQIHAAGLQLSALELAVDPMFTTDRSGVIQWVNRSFTELSGYSAAELIGERVSLLRSGRHDAAFYRELWETVLAGRAWRGELINMRRDGSCYTVEQTITPLADENGVVMNFLVVQRDITERKQHEASVQQIVTTDPLTGLPNSRALDARLAETTTDVVDGAPAAALLLIRIDGAAALRDRLGPAFADARTVQIASALAQTLRPDDFLARIGDDEFAAVLPDTPLDGAAVVVDRVNDAIADWSFDDEGHDVGQPTLSIGIAPIDGTETARAVIAMADAALYGAHDRRDGRVVLYTEPRDDDGEVEWARRIREALQDELFVLHFQPVVQLETGSVSHYDALIRLHDAGGDVIPARAFVTHAENLGLMPRIDQWVLENVLRMLRTAPELRVSMNLSATTVTSPLFRQFLERQHRRMSSVGARIIFEVPEVAVTRDLPRMLASMEQLRELGCRFALDNFGIAASSIASLGALPVDYVKLDGTLIGGIERDNARAEIVRALTSIARALGRDVIAGCAERRATVDTLPSLGIALAQGNCLGRPVPEFGRDGTSFTAVRLTPGTNAHDDFEPWAVPPLPPPRTLMDSLVA